MKCPLCDSEKKHIFTRVDSFGFPLIYYQCENCGLIFQDAEESRAADPEFYHDTYRKIYQATENPTDKDLWVQEQRAAHLASILQAYHFPPPIRVLDIGASTGVLLKTFQQVFESDVVGVEPGNAYRAYAERHDLKMYASIQALIGSGTKRFDLVSLSHVLEHFADPVGELRIIRESLLADNGLLLIEVPNFYGHDSYELAHLACYTPHTIRQVVEKAGFQVLALHRHGIPRSSLLNLYLTVLAYPSPAPNDHRPIKPERFVGFKRKLGLLYRKVAQKLFPHKAWHILPKEKSS